ncbi:hypothetical protein ACKKBG_A22540 [Auxenochlorella protothecoides x Auxenochlorella symbiontica]
MNSCSEAAEDLLALQACYPEAGALVLTPAEEQALVLQSKTGLAGELGATLHIPDVLASGEPISLNISLPIAYPREWPSLTVHSAAPRDVTAELQAVVKTTAEASQGLPCLLACVAALVAAAQDLQSSTEQQKDENPVEADARSVKGPESPDPMCCRLFWFHHIKSLTKRKVIVQEAKNLEVYPLRVWLPVTSGSRSMSISLSLGFGELVKAQWAPSLGSAAATLTTTQAHPAPCCLTHNLSPSPPAPPDRRLQQARLSRRHRCGGIPCSAGGIHGHAARAALERHGRAGGGGGWPYAPLALAPPRGRWGGYGGAGIPVPRRGGGGALPLRPQAPHGLKAWAEGGCREGGTYTEIERHRHHEP